MTRNDNPSKRCGRWRSMTRECNVCDFKSNKDNKIICNFGGIKSFLSTKSIHTFNKCKLKLKHNNQRI